MQTLSDVFSKANKLSNGCIIYSTQIRVWHNNKETYIIRAIFDAYNLPYNGKIIRRCNNHKCINPEHLYSPTKEEKFWSNIWVGGEDECWEWKSFSGTNEYANTKFNNKNVPSHRLAWELYNKQQIPDGMCICHHCDNPPCCNPNHLFLGTIQDNVDDRERKGRNKMPLSKGEEHGQHKLTESQVKEIRELYSTGNTSYYKLAVQFGVSFGNVRNIIKRKIWGWLED